MKVLTIIGARPQFVKAAMVSSKINRRSGVSEIIVHTGQHVDGNMSDVFFEQMQIPKPGYNLGISGVPHGAMVGRMLEKIEEVIVIEKPDVVMVYGDTNSTLAGALAASKSGIQLAHVEAGLRSFNMSMPEEINRILTDRVSNFLFCPSEVAMSNLKSEGYENFGGVKIVTTGDVMFDATLTYREYAQPPALPRFDFKKISGFALATIHRAENTNDEKRFVEIVEGLVSISQQIPIVLPVHPRVKTLFSELGYTEKNLDDTTRGQLVLIEPVGYFEALYLLENCEIVLTDSGGMQKEAYFCGKPCVTLRNETEWPELLDIGVNVLGGATREAIVDSYKKMILRKLDNSAQIYGDGTASKLILDHLVG